MNRLEKRIEKIDPKVKDILLLLGAGTVLVAAMIFPAFPMLLKPYLDRKKEQDRHKWEKYNLWRLKQVIKRLEKQKTVEIIDGEIKITQVGKERLLKYELESISIPSKTDGHWRLIIYDVANLKRSRRDLFQKKLKELSLYPLQESVYLTPFVCENEIEYLREIFNLHKEVQILKVTGIEYEDQYKKYFGLK